tara:strand:+ start:14200 stop:14937 length:738 start_codon:yes stop_codon:yes gene_type:complete
MKEKKGQLTIFIIIAIFIIGGVLIFFVLKTGLIKQPLSPEAENIYSLVQSCIEQEGIKTIYTIGKNGGYFFPPEFSTESGVTYYYSGGKSYMPSKEEIENEISFYLSEILFFCTRNFVDFQDLEIKQREIKTETEIKNEEVVLNINYPITIIKEESTSVIEDFKLEIPVRLGIVYDSVAEIIQEQLTSEGICLSCLLDISLKYDLYVDMMDYDEETTIFIFRDENSKINNETFVWIFANKYGVGK